MRRAASAYYVNRIDSLQKTSSSHHQIICKSISTHTQTEQQQQPQNDSIESILRVNLLAEEAATALFSGRSKFSNHRRPDVTSIRDAEQQNLDHVKKLFHQHQVRPSALNSPTKAAFGLLGALSQTLPRQASLAITSGVADALTDTYNEQLRQLHQMNHNKNNINLQNSHDHSNDVEKNSNNTDDVRRLIKILRDTQRKPEGSPESPDIMALRNINDISPEMGIAGVVKFGTQLLLDIAKKI